VTNSDFIDIAVEPSVVFAAITDLPNVGRFSPEATGGEWLNGATGPAKGVSFKGTNAREDDRWSTTAQVTAYEPSTESAFEITYKIFRIADWNYTIEPTSMGCRVTETWTDRRNKLVRRFGDSESFKREEYCQSARHSRISRRNWKHRRRELTGEGCH
jgi:hypothetical protein